jgi:RNA polymerase sigma factor (TIGR02999 family)
MTAAPLSKGSVVESRGDVTRLLAELNAGRQGAEDELVELLYGELHSLARGYLRQERSGHTLQTTALVNEAYLRLGDLKQLAWEDRAHFLRLAARAMRRVLIDHARRKQAAKRQDAGHGAALEEVAVYAKRPSAGLLALDAALDGLAQLNPKMGQVVELRYFGGLSVEDTARVMQVTSRTVLRYWRMARAWLAKEIERRTEGA